MDLDDCNEEEDESWSRPIAGFTQASTQIPRWKQRKGSKDKDQATDAQLLHRRVVIHIDVDCFYAQVEMIRNPTLRDKPLGIQQKNIVVTCNYVARKFGVTKLMYIKDAKEKCPQLALVSGEDLTNYREMSYKISEFLLKYTPHVERLGMDENYLDVTDLVEQRTDNYPSNVAGHIFGETDEDLVKDICTCGCYERIMIGSHIAEEIRAALHAEMGITCCAGISHNKLLAKLVGEQHKPNQQTSLFSHHVETFMAKLPKARNIPGVGSATAKRLAEFGVVTMTDLQQCPLEDLRKELGDNMAATIKQLSQGIDDTPVIPYSKPQTLSDEDSFKSCCSVKEASQKVRELLKSLMNRLVEDGRIAGTVRLTIRRLTAENKYTNRESKQCNIPSHVISKLTKENQEQPCDKMQDIVMCLFNKLVDVKKPFHLTLINVAFCNLAERSKNSISHFFSPQKDRNSELYLSSDWNKEDSRDTSGLCPKIQSSKQTDENCSSSDYATTCDSYTNPLICDSRKASSTCVMKAHSSQSTVTSVSPLKENDNASCSSYKRKSSSSQSSFFSKRFKKTTCESSQILNSNHIDSEVLSQLPPDIQKEIVQANSDFKSSADISVEQKSSSFQKDSHQDKSCKTETWNEKSGGSSLCKSDCTDLKSSVKVNEASDSSFVPSGYDREVFLSLPADIQRELVKEEESKAEWAYVKQVKSNSKYQQTKDTKTSKSGNLLSYFKRSK